MTLSERFETGKLSSEDLQEMADEAREWSEEDELEFEMGSFEDWQLTTKEE